MRYSFNKLQTGSGCALFQPVNETSPTTKAFPSVEKSEKSLCFTMNVMKNLLVVSTQLLDIHGVDRDARKIFWNCVLYDLRK